MSKITTIEVVNTAALEERLAAVVEIYRRGI